jgi:aminoglycoside phosphotransferase (APT) family kinase protein
MTSMNMPEAEVDIDALLVQTLLQQQRPDLADLPVVELANGWDNMVFRLGDEFTVRMPRRLMAVELVSNEQRWLPMLAERLPLPIPAPVFAGQPGGGYPFPWSICPWLPGSIVARSSLLDPFEAAQVLGTFLAALHVDAPPDAPANPYRGIPLAQRTERLHLACEQLADVVDGAAVRALWSELVDAPLNTAAVWVHGDLHPANILATDGCISGVIDFGDITSGDRATDLAVAWMMLPSETWPTFRAAAGVTDDATWMRSRAWALALSLAYLVGSADNPLMQGIGQRTLHAALQFG